MKPTTILYTIFERFFAIIENSEYAHTLSKNKSATMLKLDSEFPHKSIELETDFSGKKYVVKTIIHKFKNIYVDQLINEVIFLKTFNKSLPNTNLNVPQNAKVSVSSSFTQSRQSYIDGKELAEYNSKNILDGYEKASKILNKYWLRIDNQTKRKLPHVSTISLNLTFPFYLIISLFKAVKKYKKILQLGYIYYRCGNFEPFNMNRVKIAHRDLTPENILVSANGKINIIDFEVARVTDWVTDLALFPRFYIEYLDEDQILNYLKINLSEPKDKIQFIKLTIFYTFQLMAIEKKGSRYFKESVKYLDLLTAKILPEFMFEERNLAEFIYFKILDLIGLTNAKKMSSQNSILCYHSVDNSKWRFSTSIEDFKKQLLFLKANFNILSLGQILHDDAKSNSISLTFDDGYEDVYTNAFPIMQSMKLVGTVFVIGNTKKRNNLVLGNDKKMLSKSQIKTLLKSGWTIGYHTKTHSSLRNISRLQMATEVKSKYKYFAYPNGYYDSNIISELKKSGYEYSFTIDGGSLNLRNNSKINRIPMEGKITLKQLETLLSPGGLVFSAVFMKLLKFKEFKLKPIFIR